MSFTALSAIFCLAIFSAIKLWFDKWYISYPVLMSIGGFLSSEIIVAQGIDTGLRYYHVDCLAMLIGIGAIIIARFLSLITGFTCISKISSNKVITMKDKLLLSSSGTHGALAIALAFMIPVTFNSWWAIQSIVFGFLLVLGAF